MLDSTLYFDIQFVIPMSSHVTMVYVYLKATNVILLMTVEIIVMKKDVVCTTRVIHYSQLVYTLASYHRYVQILCFLLLLAW